MKQEALLEFFKNVDALPKGNKTLLRKNHNAYSEIKDFNVIMTIVSCFPKGEVISDAEKQNLLFVASVRCELGHDASVQPRNAVASVLSTNQSGESRFSDLLAQSTKSGKVYPLMRSYLSRYKKGVNTASLFYDLQSWDDTKYTQAGDSHTTPTKYEWAYAYTKTQK